MLRKILRITLWVLALMLVILGAYHIILYWLPITEEQWHLAGEISRNTNALAVLAASTAAYIAWGTNRARATEAKRADFKDRIHWAAQNFTAEPTLTSIAAGKIIDQFAKDTKLDANDLAIAKELSEQKKEISTTRDRKVDELIAIHQERLSLARQILGQYKTAADLPSTSREEKKEILTKLSLSFVQMTATSVDYRTLTLRNLLESIEALDKLFEVLEDIDKQRREHEPAEHDSAN